MCKTVTHCVTLTGVCTQVKLQLHYTVSHGQATTQADNDRL